MCHQRPDPQQLDIPAFCYTYEFEPSTDFSEVFAVGHEVHDYARHCVAKYGLEPHLRLNHEVSRAEFDESRHIWTVTFASGTTTLIQHEPARTDQFASMR